VLYSPANSRSTVTIYERSDSLRGKGIPPPLPPPCFPHPARHPAAAPHRQRNSSNPGGVCGSLPAFIKTNLFGKPRGNRFGVRFRGGTRIASGKLRKDGAAAEPKEHAGDAIVGRSIPKTREINLPMSYVCKRRSTYSTVTAVCRGAQSPRRPLSYRDARAGAIPSCLLCSLRLHVTLSR